VYLNGYINAIVAALARGDDPPFTKVSHGGTGQGRGAAGNGFLKSMRTRAQIPITSPRPPLRHEHPFLDNGCERVVLRECV
jgi:hypothetical protein